MVALLIPLFKILIFCNSCPELFSKEMQTVSSEQLHLIFDLHELMQIITNNDTIRESAFIVIYLCLYYRPC